MNKQIEALKMAIEALERVDRWLQERHMGNLTPLEKDALQACKEALEQPAQEPVAWMEEYQSCKVNGDERLCHSDKVFRLVQLLANQLSDCQSLCAKYAEKTVINGEQKIKEVRAIKEALEQPAQEPVALIRHENGNFSPAPSWQGLSDDEKLAIIRKWKDAHTMREQELIGLGDAIEQALKEKNCG